MILIRIRLSQLSFSHFFEDRHLLVFIIIFTGLSGWNESNHCFFFFFSIFYLCKQLHASICGWHERFNVVDYSNSKHSQTSFPKISQKHFPLKTDNSESLANESRICQTFKASNRFNWNWNIKWNISHSTSHFAFWEIECVLNWCIVFMFAGWNRIAILPSQTHRKHKMRYVVCMRIYLKMLDVSLLSYSSFHRKWITNERKNANSPSKQSRLETAIVYTY